VHINTIDRFQGKVDYTEFVGMVPMKKYGRQGSWRFPAGRKRNDPHVLVHLESGSPGKEGHYTLP
tara:strand:- start:175 stop:369 length:195 start_codon:yes stop_codon:yes gene_type:complete